jgi:Ion channel
MDPVSVVALIFGLLLLALTLWDVFQTVVVPRPTPGRFRIARYAVRGSWDVLRVLARRRSSATRDQLFGLFGPFSAVLLLVVWIVTLVFAYGLILFAVRDQMEPVPTNFATTVYFAATSLLTLGFGEIVAVGGVARFVVLLAAATGLGVVALVVTFLFSIYGSYQTRELEVIRLQATAGAPPSAVKLLEAFATLQFKERLPAFFVVWQRWAAEVLDSHVAYPVLTYFRSSHDNLSWISALGTVLDAATLVLTTIRDVPRGDAELLRRIGSHLVEDISNLGFHSGKPALLSREAFELAYARLQAVGYDLEPIAEAWPRFQAARSNYDARLETMADYWEVESQSWLGSMEELRSVVHLVEASGTRSGALLSPEEAGR